MSKSINELVAGLASLKSQEDSPSQTKLHNPDIPNFDESEEIKDNYRLAFKKPRSQPRNGAGYRLNTGPRLKSKYPGREDFITENSIDPNVIRSKIDPDSALPSLSSQSLFSLMPESVKPPHNQESLIRQANTSYLNWRNRFKPRGDSTQPPMAQPTQAPAQPTRVPSGFPIDG